MSENRKGRSPVWDHFEKVGSLGAKKCRCLHCEAILGFCGNTTNMLSHLSNHHQDIYLQVQHKLQKYRSKSASTPKRPRLLDENGNETEACANEVDVEINAAGSSSTPMDTDAPTSNERENGSTQASSSSSSSQTSRGKFMPYPRNSEKMKNFLRQLMLFIVRGMHCLSLVDNPYFIAFVRYLDPRITLPCRSTITHKHLPAMHNEAVNKLKEKLAMIRWVALTTDGWTCRNNRHYITVTVHYINLEMKMISRVLTTEHMEESCTSENLANKLKEIADNWNILNKVVAVVTDNAFNIVGAIKILASSPNCAGWRHVHCFAHTLSLIVKGAIEKTPEFLAILLRARAIVTFFHHSHKATAKLASLCKDRTTKVLAQDVATRWNSTLIMIRSLIDLKEFVQDALRFPVIDRRDLDLNEFEWEILANAVEILKPFDELTKDLSSQNYPSISKVIPSIVLVTKWLNNINQNIYVDCLKQLLTFLITGLKERFEDSQKTCTHSTPHLIATYLDPRFKKLDLYFSSVVSSEAEKRTRNHIIFSSEERSQNSQQIAAQSTQQNRSSIWEGHDEAFATSNANITAQGPNREANRIIMTEEYNILPLQPRNSDPLLFWKTKRDEGQFWPLIKVVTKFQCIPATSLPCEQLFSSAGELVSEERNRLSPDNVNMLLFLNKNA